MPADLFGDPLPRSERTPRKRRATDQDIRTIPQRIEDCARFKDLYTLSEVLNNPCTRRTGKPPDYPPYVY